MTIEIKKGNIFTSKCQTIVNTVNCVGVMGAGIALEYRFRFPEMYIEYQKLCKEQSLQPGKLWIYKKNSQWVLNFPTKKDWKHPSQMKYLELGLEKFVDNYQKKGIQSIAFPLLGADRGGLNQKDVIDVMARYLNNIDILVEIYLYDPRAMDDLFDDFKNKFLHYDSDFIAKESGIKKLCVDRIKQALANTDICQLNQLGKEKGIGLVTLEKAFLYCQNSLRAANEPTQISLAF